MVAIVCRIRKDGTESDIGMNDAFLTHGYKTVKGLIRYGINAQWANANVYGGSVRIQTWCSTSSMYRSDTPTTYFIKKYQQKGCQSMNSFYFGTQEKAVTGVVRANELNPEFISDEILGAISIGQLEHEKECEEEYCDCMDVWQYPLLLGTWKKEKGLWMESKKRGEYSAIIQEDSEHIQVVWSKYAIRCNKCSPCFPNQGDITSDGDRLAYCMPFEFFEDEWLKENKDRLYVRGTNGHWKKYAFKGDLSNA